MLSQSLALSIQNLPEYMQESVERYITVGQPLGDFLQAVFENNLMRAFMTADHTNQLNMKAYATMLYHAPLRCFGSKELVDKWINGGGLVGHMTNTGKGEKK